LFISGGNEAFGDEIEKSLFELEKVLFGDLLGFKGFLFLNGYSVASGESKK
jgi:hypothetical protein